VTTTRQEGTKSTNRQTPSSWLWSRSPLQRHGFDEPTPPEGWAALHMLVPMPPSIRRMNTQFLYVEVIVQQLIQPNIRMKNDIGSDGLYGVVQAWVGHKVTFLTLP